MNTIKEKEKTIPFFNLEEKLQIDSFLLIPKLLFDKKYKSLSTYARFIYSFYLNRYSSTRFKDNQSRPYIIYPDKELMDTLKINRSTCSRAKKELVKLELISLEKSTSYNRIYIYSFYNSIDNKFYITEDFKKMQFYRFPTLLFDEIFDSLNINTKLLYAYYLDYISLSQIHRFADKNDRVYFYDDSSNQGKEIGLSARTITTARNILYASGLLFKYQGYGAKVQYYLKKLSAFNNESLITYIELDDSLKKEFIKQKNREEHEQFEQFSKKATQPVEKVEKMQHDDSLEILQHVEMQNSYIEDSKKETSVSQISVQEFSKKDSHIINTKLKETNLNNSLINYIKEFRNYTNSLMIKDDIKKEFIIALLDKIESSSRFILKRNQHHIQLEENDLVREFSKITNEYQFGTLFNSTIDKIESKGYVFRSPESQLNCLLTFILNELMDNENLNHLQKPSWFNKYTYARASTYVNSEFSEDIRNYNWWEE